MKYESYALIDNGSNLVLNTIVANKDYKLDGNYIIELQDGLKCEVGMFYNVKDGRFYDNPIIKE